jgi:hypothetical protein
MPHLVIHGKSSEFQSALLEDGMRHVRLVAIPSNTMAIIDISTSGFKSQ